MWRKFIIAGALLVGSVSAKAAPVITCGQARPDLKVCITSWALPGGPSGTSLSLRYASGESYSVTPQFKADAEGQGIQWYWGAGQIRGTWMDLWLRVDITPTFLPVYPGYPAKAKLFYRTVPGAQWQLTPGSAEFTLNASASN